MSRLSEALTQNQTAMLAAVGGVVALFLLGLLLGRVRSGNRKKRLRGEGMAELAFDQTVRLAGRMATSAQFQGYKLYSANGAQPTVVANSVFVPAGHCQVEVAYFDTEYVTRRRSATTTWGRQLLELEVQGGRRYAITFDQEAGAFSAKER